MLQPDITDWETAFEARCPIAEDELVRLINASLRAYPDIGCVVHTLRFSDSPMRNWNVAAFELEDSHGRDRSRRLDLAARVMAEAAHGYEVDWPSTQLH